MGARIHIETAGCAFNVSDSEAMAGVLARAGYEIAETPADAELLILNTCTVKDRTHRDFRRRLRALGSGGGAAGCAPRVVLTGCIPKAAPMDPMLAPFSLVGPDSVGRIDEVVRETLRGRVVRALDGTDGDRNSLPVRRKNPAVEIIPIARGCRSACTFCQTRLARGRLESFPAASILGQARRALDEGVKILWITAQDTGAYGHDRGEGLPELLGGILALPGDFRVRLGMSSPQWIAERLDEFIAILGHPKMFKFLHVPLQSGSDRVLAAMRRDGGVAEFRAIHAAFRERFPQGSFVTDLIAGFPGETEEEFGRTLALVDELRLAQVNVSRFSARPGTAAARMPPLPQAVIKERTARLLGRVRETGLASLRPWIGKACGVVVEQPGGTGEMIARTEGYRPVHLAVADVSPGEWLAVRITGAEPFHLRAVAEGAPDQGATYPRFRRDSPASSESALCESVSPASAAVAALR